MVLFIYYTLSFIILIFSDTSVLDSEVNITFSVSMKNVKFQCVR